MPASLKNTLTHIVNYEKIIFDKKKVIKKLQHDVHQFEKTLEYLRFKKAYSLKMSEYYLCKGIFLHVFLYPERYYTSTK